MKYKCLDCGSVGYFTIHDVLQGEHCCENCGSENVKQHTDIIPEWKKEKREKGTLPALEKVIESLNETEWFLTTTELTGIVMAQYWLSKTLEELKKRVQEGEKDDSARTDRNVA